MNRRIRYWLLLLVILASTYYFAKTLYPVMKLKMPAYPEYTETSRVIRIAVNREFAIVLDSNPTTGYGWQLAEPLDPTILKVLEIKHDLKKVKRVGQGGKDRWIFKALRPGNGFVSLEYVRPWEKGVAPAKKAEFEIIIS